jgi:hypothetical protein
VYPLPSVQILVDPVNVSEENTPSQLNHSMEELSAVNKLYPTQLETVVVVVVVIEQLVPVSVPNSI